MRFACMLMVFAVIMTAGCTAERFGSALEGGAPTVKVKDIIIDPALVGRVVTVAGTISSQCGSNGCWFVLNDDTGQVFVNLAPAQLTLPPRMGKAVKVSGTVSPVEGVNQLFAQGVEVR